MEEGSILGSLDRIETAIARIEAASRERAKSATAGATVDAELEQRHVALKSAVEHALTRIDTLIADQA
jgi:hypothetical protein